MTSALFESTDASDVGKKRKNNEDARLRLPERGIYCVADGMGGQAGGDLASNAIVTSLEQVFVKSPTSAEDSFNQRLQLFRDGCNQASKWIKNFSDEKGVGQMGSTVVGLILDPQNPHRAASLHAGDSRLYRYRNGNITQITADHSAVAVLAAKLGRTPESLPAKYQNDLLRAVGLEESVVLDKNSIDLTSGDLFLLCSDGLTKMLPDQQICQMISAGSQTSLTTLAQKLIDAANEAGGRDNVTVMLIRAGELPSPDASPAPDVDAEDEAETPTVAPTVIFPEGQTIDSHHPATSESSDIHGETPQTKDPPTIQFFPPAKTPEPEPVPVPVPPQKSGASPAWILLFLALLVAAGVWFWFSPQSAGVKKKWLGQLQGVPHAPAAVAPAASATTTTNR